MKRLFAAVIPLVLSACADTGLPEIPTIGVGGGGVTLMDQQRDPYEAYDKAYSEMTKQHLNVRRDMDPQRSNRFGAESAIERIIRNIEIMKSVLVKPEPKTLDPYLEFYRECLKLVQQNRWGGGWATKFDESERKFKLQFPIDKVELVEEFRGDPKKDDASKTDPKKTDSGAKKDDERLPDPKEKKDEPKTDTSSEKKDEPRTEPGTLGVSFRLLYKAWARAHADLAEAYSSKKECKEKYEDVMEALRLLKAQVDKPKAEKLAIYIGYYGTLYEKTKGFTTVPEKETQESVLGELKIVASVIESMLNPDKK